MKYLYIRQNIEDPSLIIIGDESEIGGRDTAYTHKGATVKNDKGNLSIQYPRVTDDIELGKNGYERDYQVHKFVKEQCIDLVKYLGNSKVNTTSNTREGFKIIGRDYDSVIGELYKRINCEINGKQAGQWKVKKGPQKEATVALNKFMQSNKKEFLLNAFCRMGKTFTSLYTFERSTAKTGLFISGKTEAIRECFYTRHACSNFDDITIVNFKDYDKMTKKTDRIIIADTCQAIQRRVKAGKDIPSVDIIFFDECHFYNTTSIQNAINNKYKKLIYMSATPEDLLNSGNYNPTYKNIYEFTLVDLYKKLEDGTLNKDEYILPRMFVPSIQDYIKRMQAIRALKDSTIDYLNECTDDNGFSFSSFLEVDEAGTFLHSEEVSLFAKALMAFLRDAGKKINYEGDLKNFMIFMPQHHEKTEQFVELLRQYATDKDKIYTAVADNEGIIKDDLLSMIKSDMSAKEGLTIVCTYQRFGTGCTIKDLQATMFLNDTDNCSVILQNLSRCLSINDEKKYGVVFEMNQSRAITDRFKIICSKYGQLLEGKVAQKIFGEVMNLMPINLITEFGTLQEVELNYDEAFMSYRKLNGASNIFEGDIDYSSLADILKNIDKLASTTSLTSKQAQIAAACKVISTVKGTSNWAKKESTDINAIKAKLLALSNYLKTCWYCSNATNLKEFKKFFKDAENKEDFGYTTSISWNDFEKAILPILNEEKFTAICNDYLTIDIKKLDSSTEFNYIPIEVF